MDADKFIVIATLISAFSGIVHATTGPVCIGQICFRPSLSTEDKIIGAYGQGAIVLGGIRKIEDERTRCYFDSKSSAFVLLNFYHRHGQVMSISSTFISTEQLCEKPARSARSFAPIRLRVPISLGAPEAEVIAKLGPPARVDDTVALEARDVRYKDKPGYGSRFGEKKLVYFPEGEKSLLGWAIHVSGGHVKSVEIWDSP